MFAVLDEMGVLENYTSVPCWGEVAREERDATMDGLGSSWNGRGGTAEGGAYVGEGIEFIAEDRVYAGVEEGAYIGAEEEARVGAEGRASLHLNLQCHFGRKRALTLNIHLQKKNFHYSSSIDSS